jgi:hypothetical protein
MVFSKELPRPSQSLNAAHIASWPLDRTYVCTRCGDHAHIDPADSSRWGCNGCDDFDNLRFRPVITGAELLAEAA